MFRSTRSRVVTLATEYADQSTTGDAVEFVIPEDLSALTDSELAALQEQAVSNFDALYGDGTDLTQDDLDALAALTEGIEALQAVTSERQAAAQARQAQAAELRSKITAHSSQPEEGEEEQPAEGEEEDPAAGAEEEDPAVTDDEGAAQTVVASGRKAVRVNMSRARSRQLPRSGETAVARGIKDVMRAAGDGTGFTAGTGIDWTGAGKIVDRRIGSFNQAQYAAAARNKQHLRQQLPVLTIERQIPDDLRITGNDPVHVEEVLQRAANESRLPQGSLVASGGWCAPSETLYGLLELETRDGIFSLPEVGMARGGINRTLGPDFSTIFNAYNGFHYTEAQDIAGTYGVDANGIGNGTAGDKPCYKVDCPDFEEFRLDVDGLCITAGLLQQRGFPEVIARTIRGVLVAHDHRLAGRRLAAIQAGSTAVTMAAGQQSATASLLTAIELEVEKVRTLTRISRAATMEAVFPFWVRGVIRADLSRRNGVELLSVTDAQIAAWFTLRGIAPQFVYNFQDLDTAATTVQYPETVTFLLYPAGTWVQGAGDIITIDTLYDSVLLGQNDYLALFTEEAQVVIPMGHESRAVTVPVIPDGTTGAQVLFDADGTTVAAATV